MSTIKKFIELEKNLLMKSSYRGRLKEGLLRCRNEAKDYHSCVTIHHLETQEK
jgi:hypothetical protein